MTKLGPRGVVPYGKEEFKWFMNKHYYPARNMKTSVETLQKKKVDLFNVKYGEYQPVLELPTYWPPGSYDAWQATVTEMRGHLDDHPYNAPLSTDQPQVIIDDQLQLLDKAIQKCFTSDPPIPMLVDVEEQPDVDDNTNKFSHTVEVKWRYPENDGTKTPDLLELKIICPIKASRGRSA
jgi:hypothetical protein